ncbi:hypothetical protein [Streptomyces sp. NPDC051662]|uniref:hypothetical protein n=1 Tax=Streptomyces sp. NPDC051662 TaxID=3154750 RepID=UPI0034380AAD
MTTTEPRSSPRSQQDAHLWLRRFLALDAGTTLINGVAYLVASEPLGRLLGVGSGLLFGLGAFLTAFAALVGYLAGRPKPSVPAVLAVVEANAVWAVLSIVALTLWLDGPSTAGQVWIPLQAVTVGGFAALQYTALRRSRS